MSLILLVEDDPTIHRAVRDKLRFERHDVLSATDGETGYRLATEKKPDVMILDVMLPKMTGFEVCRKRRAAKKATAFWDLILALMITSPNLARLKNFSLACARSCAAREPPKRCRKRCASTISPLTSSATKRFATASPSI